MKKTVSLSLLILVSQVAAKAPHASRPSDFFRRIADEMDNVGKEMSTFGEQFTQEMQDLWQEAGTRANKVKRAFSSSSALSIKDEKEAVIINAQIGAIAPNKDATITVTDNSFKVEIKEGGNSIQITGSIDRNMLVAQITGYKEHKTEDGTSQSSAVQSSVIQRTLVDKVSIEKLSADFNQATKTLSISIPKKITPAKEMRKVPININ